MSNVKSALRLQDLPDDVQLMILRFCDLDDALRFCSTCKTLNALLQKRIFWICALEGLRARMPIPIPIHEDLATHSLSSLQKIAFHTLRLKQNWDLPRPKIIGPIKAVELGQLRYDVLFQVPGTELYLLHSRREGFVVCWDVGLARAVTEPLRVAHRILDVSPGQDDPGRFSMGLLIVDGNITVSRVSLAIICLQYDQPQISVTITFRHDFQISRSSDYWAVFMTREIVGVLRRDSTLADPQIGIIAFNTSSRNMTLIQTDIPYQIPALEGHSGTSTCDGDVFIMVEYHNSSFLYRCPGAILPTNENVNCPSQALLKCHQECKSVIWNTAGMVLDEPLPIWYNAEGALSADPHYGVPAVSVHRVLTQGQPPAMQIRFWTCSKLGHEDNPKAGPTLTPHVSPNIPGGLQHSPDSSWQLMLLPHSGRQILLVIDVDQEQPILQLVRFHPETGTCSVHELDLPPFIDLSFVYGLSLDDHRGVISLVDSRNVLYAIPYA